MSLNFGTVAVGKSQNQVFTLTNRSSSTLKVTHVAVIGAGFSLPGLTTPLLLSPHEKASFEVIFAPQSAITINGSLAIISKATDSPLHVTLSGTGWIPVTSKVPPRFFGLDVHPKVLNDRIPWPNITFGSLRLWNTLTQWNQLNTAAGTYDWTNLDGWLSLAAQNGVKDVLYVFGNVPPWASSNPGDQLCTSQDAPPGSCDPPYDVNPDGSGTDQVWRDFVTAIVTHAAGRIRYWEVWNEPDIPSEWNGTDAQLVRMAKDAYTIIKALDPTATVTTPTSVNSAPPKSIKRWLPGYLAAGGDAYADVVTFHGYVNTGMGQQPENITKTVDDVTTAIAGSALSSKPIWNTEGAWTQDSNLQEPDLQAALLARIYLLQWFKGVSRFYWYQYGNTDVGTMWTPAGPNKAEIAYGQVYDWLVGASLSGPCTASGTVWTCTFTKVGGIQEQVVWDASKTCSNGNCTTSGYTPDSVYTQYTDLEGNVTTFSPGTRVHIGAKPILLANQ